MVLTTDRPTTNAHNLFMDSHVPYRKESLPGMKLPIEGAPHATWRILQRQGIITGPLGIVWPKGESGIARIPEAVYKLDPASQTIYYAAPRPESFFSVMEALEYVRTCRNKGLLKAEEGTWAKWRDQDVQRCDFEHCDFIGGWHSKARPQHVAQDMKKDGYDCKIVFEHGMWIPKVRIYRTDPTPEMLASFESDARWVFTEYLKLT